MAISKGRTTRESSMTIEQLLQHIDEGCIVHHYLGIENVPCVISSPLRVDRHPSLGVGYDGEMVYYTDYKTRDSYTTFTLLKELWNLESVGHVIDRIYNELVLNAGSIGSINYLNPSERKEAKLEKSSIKISVKTRDWRKYDLEFWKQFGINQQWLEFSRTYPISHVFIEKDNGDKFTISADKYAYVYVEFKDGVETLKVYQPYSDKHKWSNNHDSSVWDLWQQLPETGEILIITSSRKDALSIWANTGIPACSLQAESCLPKHQVVDELKRRFKYVFILYDNDYHKDVNAGRLAGERIANEYGLTQIELPSVYLSKDPSDLFKNHGSYTFQEVILRLIKNKLKNQKN